MKAPWVDRYGLKHPYGLCQCGCGQRTGLARQTDTKLGYAKGEPVMYRLNHGRTAATLAEAFWANVTPGHPDKCWEWAGSKTMYGYGRIKRHGIVSMAHKVSYELHNGRIPDGLVVCHACDSRGCVNPAHLFLGTDADNSADMVEKDRQAKGQRVATSKLDPDSVKDIRRLYDEGMTQYELSSKFKVAQPTISAILRRKTWRHIP